MPNSAIRLAWAILIAAAAAPATRVARAQSGDYVVNDRRSSARACSTLAVQLAAPSEALLARLESWRVNRVPGSETDLLAGEILALPPETRQAVLESGARAPKESSRTLRLLLHEPATWLELIDRLCEQGGGEDLRQRSAEDLSGRGIARIALELRSPAREAVLERIRQKYRTVSKNAPAGLGPRRALDVLLSQLLPAYRIVPGALRQGLNPEQAVNRYLERIREVTGTAPSQGYDARDILETARRTRHWLSQVPTDSTFPKQVRLYGSFTNGKADLANFDVDMILMIPDSASERERWQLKPDLTTLRRATGSLQGDLSPLLRRPHLPFSFAVEPIEGSGREAGKFAQLNPLMIDITPEGATLLLYPPIGLEASDGRGVRTPEPIAIPLP